MKNNKQEEIDMWFGSELISQPHWIDLRAVEVSYSSVNLSALLEQGQDVAESNSEPALVFCLQQKEGKKKKIFDILFPESQYTRTKFKKMRKALVSNILTAYPEFNSVYQLNSVNSPDSNNGIWILFSREFVNDYIIPNTLSIPFLFNGQTGYLVCAESELDNVRPDKLFPLFHSTVPIDELEFNSPTFPGNVPKVGWISPRGVIYVEDPSWSIVPGTGLKQKAESLFLLTLYVSVDRQVQVNAISNTDLFNVPIQVVPSSNSNDYLLTLLLRMRPSTICSEAQLIKFVNEHLAKRNTTNTGYSGNVQYLDSDFKTIDIQYDYPGQNAMTLTETRNPTMPAVSPTTVKEFQCSFYLTNAGNSSGTISIANSAQFQSMVQSFDIMFVQNHSILQGSRSVARRFYWKSVKQKRSFRTIIPQSKWVEQDPGTKKQMIASFLLGLNEKGDVLAKSPLDKKKPFSQLVRVFKKFFFSREE